MTVVDFFVMVMLVLSLVALRKYHLNIQPDSDTPVDKSVPPGLLGYEFPQVVQMVFKQHNPHRTNEQAQLAFAALKDFFILMWLERNAGRKETLAMPSVLADEAWHAFVVCTRPYEEFCKAYFGSLVHHMPNPLSQPTVMDGGSKANEEVVRLWKAYGKHRGSMSNHLHANKRGTPLLFALDSDERINPGWIWTPAAQAALTRTAYASGNSSADSGSGGGADAGFAGTGSYNSCGASASASCADSVDGGGSSCGGGSGCGGGGD